MINFTIIPKYILVQNIAPLQLNSFCFYSTNNNINTSSEYTPVISYPNADTQKTNILNDNRNKAGIYR